MNWFYNAKLSTKLFISFALCAVITLAVGMVASRGIGELATNLKLAFSNNLVSVSKTNEATTNVVEQNRDVYRLL
ncbi:Methyl-accepting chemotaxis protein [Pseudomonas syringae pv. helianthi]|nr:Methyl-accepting chemotaxis protein [Pseudomonas syringae pv. helianthi]